MINKIILLITITCSIVSFAQSSYTDERTGIKICFDSEENMFPKSWYNSRVNATSKSLDTAEHSRSKKIIKLIFEKYPEAVLKNNLKTIYVLDSFSFFGQSYGGTYSDSNVYLSNKGINNGYTDFYIEQVFHAEFSSVLLNNYKAFYNENEWTKNNPTEFNYGKGGLDALKNKKSSETFDNQLNEIGFINQYALSSSENDFNSFAKNLFMPRKGFYELVQSYPNLAYKLKIIIQFYNKIDPFFTTEFFNKILARPK
jgi:hypothetical protein